MKRKWVVLVMSLSLLSALSITVTASDSTKTVPRQSVTIKASAKKVKAGWIKKGKYKYYRKSNGKLCKNERITIKGSVYRFNKKGVMITGEVKEDGKVYYYDKKTGMESYVKVKVKATGKDDLFLTMKDSRNRKYLFSKKEVEKKY